MSRQSDFYNAVYDKARELGANDVQARLAAAQASEETGFGQSMVGNNAFGIKASSNYTGPSVAASTEEEYNGNTVREVANFRSYDDFTDSVKDYLSTIQTNFPDAWGASTFSEAVKGLSKGVYGKYATRAAYGSHIKAIDNKFGDLAYADEVGNVPTPYGPNDVVDLAGLPNDVVPIVDPNFAPIDHDFAYAANPANVPSQTLSTDQGLMAPQVADEDTQVTNGLGWGFNRDVAPAPIPAFNQWGDMAAAPPVQAPVDETQGFLNAPVNSFVDPAAAGPFGGDFAAPADRFASPTSEQSQPFDRYVQTTSIPTQVDLNRYQPGTAPMIDVSGVPANRVQSVSITPDQAGFLNAPPASQPISQEDINRALFDPTGNALMDPSFTEAMMSPQNPVVPTAVETISVAPGVDLASSRFSTPPKTSRIGQEPAFDEARMPSLVDPQTNVTSFTDQPADIGGFLNAAAVQRGAPTGLDSAEMQTRQGMAQIALQKAQEEQQAKAIAANPALAMPNFDQALNPTVPSLSVPSVETGFLNQPSMPAPADIVSQPAPTATPQQQAAGYQQFADKAKSITNLSGTTGIWDDGTAFPNTLTAPAMSLEAEPAPDLETVDVADQPAITDKQVNIPGPATTPAEDQQQLTAPSKTPRTVPAATVAQSSFSDRIAKALNPGTAVGAAIGAGFLGIPGAVAGAFLGNQVNGFLNKPSQPMAINNIGSGSDAVYSIWGGGTPAGTQATASDGQQVTSMGNGYTAITGKSGVVTVFDPSGKAMSYFGDSLGQDQDQASTSTSSGGIFGGLFG